jgi:hypothetical protein
VLWRCSQKIENKKKDQNPKTAGWLRKPSSSTTTTTGFGEES